MMTLAQLQEATWPTLAIHLARAEIVAANPQARSILRLGRDVQLPVQLDSAMPALRRLRLLNAKGAAEHLRETLVFWWQGRPVASACQIDVSGDAAEPMAFVQFLNAERYDATVTSKQKPDVSASAAKTSAPGDELREAKPIKPSPPNLNGSKYATDHPAPDRLDMAARQCCRDSAAPPGPLQSPAQPPEAGQSVRSTRPSRPQADAVSPVPSFDLTDPASGYADPEEPPRQDRDDRQTLAEIARRILAGQTQATRTDARAAVEPLYPVPGSPTVAASAPNETVASAPDHDLQPDASPIAPSDMSDKHTKSGSVGPTPDPAPAANADHSREEHYLGDRREVTSHTVSRLAHELKTPLTAIAAAAEIMRDQRLGNMSNPRYVEYAGDIHDSAQHALTLIARLLTNDQHDASEVHGLNDLLELNDIVDGVVSMMRPLADKRTITLGQRLDVGAPKVMGNATMVRQILINLTTNALKFTPEGGDVRLVTGFLDTGAAFVVVRDTGGGLSQSIVERARQQAAQNVADDQDPAKPRAGGGYGIGLPLVLRLMDQLGGEVEFESTPGRGTVVMLSFATGQPSTSRHQA